MNKLIAAKRVSVVAALVEGNSINSTVRMTGVSKPTILKLLVDLGMACQRHHDATVRGLRCERVQVDENLVVRLTLASQLRLSSPPPPPENAVALSPDPSGEGTGAATSRRRYDGGVMPKPIERTTLVTLKARHQAMRIAASVLDAAAPVDAHAGYCRACGAAIDLRENIDGIAVCGACGASVRVPPHAIVGVPRVLEAREVQARAAAMDRYARWRASRRVELALTWAFVICCAVLAAANVMSRILHP